MQGRIQVRRLDIRNSSNCSFELRKGRQHLCLAIVVEWLLLSAVGWRPGTVLQYAASVIASR